MIGKKSMLLGKRILLVLLSVLVLFGQGAQAQTKQSADCIFLGGKPSFIVKFKNQTSSLASRTTLTHAALQSLSIDGVTFTQAKPLSGGAYVVFFKPTSDSTLRQSQPGCYTHDSIQRLMNRMKSKNAIEYIDPNVLSEPLSFKRMIGPVTSVQWDFFAPPGGMDIQTAWNTTSGNSHAITAVLDTGYLTNASLSPSIEGLVSFVDNGVVTTGATPLCGSECSGYDHGTHVSGTVSASGTLAYGQTIFGVAPTAKVLIINVFTKFTDNITCRGTPPCLRSNTADQVNALNWLAGSHFSEIPDAPYVTDINMSLGGEGVCPVSQQNAFNALLGKNISIAIAAGNDNVDVATSSPANCDGVFAIASTDQNGFGAYYSNYGALITVAAPGGTTTPSITGGIYSTVENGYDFMQGTSMASPHVAGLLALLYSVDPTLTPATALTLLTSTATAFPSGGAGFSCTPSKPCGAGIVNAALAVQQALSQAPTLNWTPNLNVTQSNAEVFSLRWSPAAWSPSRTAPVIYTTHVAGSAVNCTNTFDVFCNITGLTLYTHYTAYVTATDSRQIYPALTSDSFTFSTYPTLIAPNITGVTRNPLLRSQAFVYYSNGNLLYSGYSYLLQGLSGTSIQLDAKNHRFIISNITQASAINQVSISINNNDPLGNQFAQTASFTIPSILGG